MIFLSFSVAKLIYFKYYTITLKPSLHTCRSIHLVPHAPLGSTISYYNYNLITYYAALELLNKGSGRRQTLHTFRRVHFDERERRGKRGSAINDGNDYILREQEKQKCKRMCVRNFPPTLVGAASISFSKRAKTSLNHICERSTTLLHAPL